MKLRLSEAEFIKITGGEEAYEKPKKKKSTSHANRGMTLEKLIEKACEQYESNGVANIKKVSTPWTVIRKGPRIVNAFPTGPSTVDFMGEVNGRAICFESKKTDNKTSFPLSNFEEHQIEFMRNWKGIKFVIIEFTAHKKIFFVGYSHIASAWDASKHGDRKSIPYQWFTEWAKEIDQSNGVVLDFLREVG